MDDGKSRGLISSTVYRLWSNVYRLTANFSVQITGRRTHLSWRYELSSYHHSTATLLQPFESYIGVYQNVVGQSGS